MKWRKDDYEKLDAMRVTQLELLEKLNKASSDFQEAVDKATLAAKEMNRAVDRFKKERGSR